MDEVLRDCPICKQPVNVGYACGDYFTHCTEGCPSPMCDHPSKEVTIKEWNEWVLAHPPDDVPHLCWSCVNGFYTDEGFDCDQTHYNSESPYCLSWVWNGKQLNKTGQNNSYAEKPCK